MRRCLHASHSLAVPDPLARLIQTARRHAEALAHKTQQERDSLQRALDDSLQRLRSGDGNLVDRRVVNKLLVSACVYAHGTVACG